ncbi:MAG: DUF2202 domain-containing protein [Clostridia bacterium]|nr:DUF2202 domain-containing protein [Clostridia bacterium]
MKKLAMLLLVGSMVLAPTTAFADTIGSQNIVENETYTLEEMLQYAYEDEIMAEYEYQSLIDELGVSRPFTNIIKAEQRHIELVLDLYEAYDLDVPEFDPSTHVVLPESFTEAMAIGVEAEIANIAMYEAFLSQELPEDVKATFIALQSGSESHLKAFSGENGQGGNSGQSNSSTNFRGNGRRGR